jgi:glycoside/pentoside/hexuronide:cation symporter, GPH family
VKPRSEAQPPRLGIIAGYALPALASQFVAAPFTSVVPGIYAKYFGVSAGAIALVLLASRVFDAISDPMIGYWSDATRSRLGRRKPWLIAGSLLTAFALWNLTAAPGPDRDPVVQFAFWSLLFYAGWTMMEIPHTAWAAELTSDYNARNRVFFLRTVMGVLGMLGFAAVPLLMEAPSTEMTPEVLRRVALWFAVLAPLCVGCAVVCVPSGSGHGRPHAPVRLMPTLRALRTNAPLWRLLGVFVLGGLASGINGTLLYIYLDTYLGIGDKVPYALGAMLLAGLLGMPLWLLIMRRVDKHRAWALSLGCASLWVAAPVLLTPGGDSFVPYLIMVVGLALSSGAGAIAPFALLGDVVDFDELRTRVSRSGAYYAVFLFGVKVNAAIGGSIAFAILAVVGYDPAATRHADSAVLGLKLAFGALPALLFAVAAVSIWSFPMTRRRHEVVRRALMRRAKRTEADPAPTS